MQPVFKRGALLFAPAGGVHCTLWDTLAYLRFHLDGFAAGHPLLEHAEMARLHRVYAVGGSNSRGVAYTPGGWVRQRPDWARGAILTHRGSNTLHFARAVIAPGRQAALIAVSNAGAPEGEAAVEAVLELLIDRLK